jgi:hypothetical protein
MESGSRSEGSLAMTDEKILQATAKLQHYIESEKYCGYDPYDALKSPLFQLPVLKSNKLIRFTVQQLVKRSPFDLRPLLQISKGRNPVTLGLCIQAYTSLLRIQPYDKSLVEKCDFLVDELVKLIPAGFHGACWGYDFDWEARHAKIPAYQPTVVATGIITHALFRYYSISGNLKALDLCRSACRFVLEDLQKTESPEGDFCFSYSPFDRQCVFNASMKGVRILSQVYGITRDENLRSSAEAAVKFVTRHQQETGAWRYSTAASGSKVDNYHTGYVLDCLDEYMRHTGDRSCEKYLSKGLGYYRNNFFENDTIPKFYDNSVYPVDCTAAAQSLLTLCRFKETDLARNVATWMIGSMQDEKGYFYFRRFKTYTKKNSFMRWSNAWMFAGLTALLEELNT